jgi:hypothetical protein
MAYNVVFNISTVGYKEWPYVAGGSAFIFLGILLVKYAHRVSIWDNMSRGFRRIFSWIFLSVGISWTIFVFIGTYFQYVSMLDDYKKGHYEVVEGVVTNFKPMPYSGHMDECFTVNTVRFCYSDYGGTPGFNNTRSHGGPIRSGLHVRISYVDNVILKLEIAE